MIATIVVRGHSKTTTTHLWVNCLYQTKFTHLCVLKEKGEGDRRVEGVGEERRGREGRRGREWERERERKRERERERGGEVQKEQDEEEKR